MKSRYDYIKDPAERRQLARAQLAAVAVLVALVAAMVLVHPADTRPANGNTGVARSAPATSSPLDTRTIGRGEGA